MTLTKEQLQQIEAAAKEVLWPVVWSEKKEREHFSKKITPEVVLELARIALASLETDGVAECQHDWIFGGLNKLQSQKQCVKCGRVELVAPPAPVVPDAIEMDDDFDSAFEHGKAVGWNACRAAIIKQPSTIQSSDIACSGVEIKQPASKSLQVPEGWVPCSERMPSVGEIVLAYRPDAPESNDPLIKMATYVGKSAHGHGFDCYCKPSHWMPLPAAPEQEV